MPVTESKEIWTRVEIECNWIGDPGICCAADDDGPAYIMDIANSPEGARRVTFMIATKNGWVQELKSKRWLCPECQKVRANSADRR
jgi:hypothetical protein